MQPQLQAALDSTGLESHHISRHFLHRTGRCKHWRRWTKVALACHTRSHLILGAEVSVGPNNDCPHFAPLVKQASALIAIAELLADGAFDSEPNHRLARALGIRRTLIPVNLRGSEQAPMGRYRRALHQRFPRRRYAQRAQVESVISRHKRRLGAVLRHRSPATRTQECLLRIVTHDLMILRR